MSIGALLLGLLLAASPVVAEETASAAPPLRLAAVTVARAGNAADPKPPGVDTLCKLSVKLENDGPGPVSGFHFKVEVGGVALPVYGSQMFMALAPAGETLDLKLYNFWTTETGRPAPKDGKLPVVVTLDEAYRIAVTTEADGTEVWTLGEPLGGLPQTVRVDLQLAAP